MPLTRVAGHRRIEAGFAFSRLLKNRSNPLPDPSTLLRAGSRGVCPEREKQIPLFSLGFARDKARDDSEGARDDSVRRYRRSIRPGWLACVRRRQLRLAVL